MTVSVAARPVGGLTSTTVDLTVTVTAGGGFTMPPASYSIWWTDATGGPPDLVVVTTDTTITRRHTFPTIGTYDIAISVEDAVAGGTAFDDGHSGFVLNYEAWVNYGDMTGLARPSRVGFEV